MRKRHHHQPQETTWENEERESEKIAYTEVPTQNEMLGYSAQTDSEKHPKPGADHSVTHELDNALYEACQNGNIGGG